MQINQGPQTGQVGMEVSRPEVPSQALPEETPQTPPVIDSPVTNRIPIETPSETSLPSAENHLTAEEPAVSVPSPEPTPSVQIPIEPPVAENPVYTPPQESSVAQEPPVNQNSHPDAVPPLDNPLALEHHIAGLPVDPQQPATTEDPSQSFQTQKNEMNFGQVAIGDQLESQAPSPIPAPPPKAPVITAEAPETASFINTSGLPLPKPSNEAITPDVANGTSPQQPVPTELGQDSLAALRQAEGSLGQIQEIVGNLSEQQRKALLNFLESIGNNGGDPVETNQREAQ
ncbi:MAG: hypothetical protein BWY43_00535 [candidate division WS2 bacterium ADurb.Bin280]|uniref:Uncharacterized protein n=1 Tax=candidate division WS2 bacterium ADurb.Bin280 TaxID=1852829 RepID=A0A1V5SDA8_9BACT|nr:MAG: hypothetical protein BWY43_00535 [candidate division WS2 bacterium ADurb.Bin280]